MKSTFTYFFVAFSFFIFFGCAFDDDFEVESIEDLEEKLDFEMKDQRIPALSILIFKNDNVLYENYLGVSNIEANTTLTDVDMFLIASISKVLTATALLQLYENGAFDLDDPINDYLPFEVNVPGFSTEITFKMLLTHTSAIADNDPVMDGQYYYNQDPSISLSYFMENYFTVGGEFYDDNKNFYNDEPGSKHRYSNIGSALIGVLVEEISGQDFNSYCKNNIFLPLGMHNTSWRLDEINQTIVTPYDYESGSYQEFQHYTNTDYPNGGLRTTVQDFHQFITAFVNGGRSNNHQLLTQETVNTILTPYLTNSYGEEVGLHIFYNKQYKLWLHDGGEQGVSTIMGFNKNSKVGAIIFTNQGYAEVENLLIKAYELGEKL